MLKDSLFKMPEFPTALEKGVGSLSARLTCSHTGHASGLVRGEHHVLLEQRRGLQGQGNLLIELPWQTCWPVRLSQPCPLRLLLATC